jgi:hypothetical protein
VILQADNSARRRRGDGPDSGYDPYFMVASATGRGQEDGRGWQPGQKNDDRFMNGSRRTGTPQRGHGCPARP